VLELYSPLRGVSELLTSESGILDFTSGKLKTQQRVRCLCQHPLMLHQSSRSPAEQFLMRMSLEVGPGYFSSLQDLLFFSFVSICSPTSRGDLRGRH
jgi:hypothetical protein